MSTPPQQSSTSEEEIIIKVHIDHHIFEINCDTGIQDIAWLSITACYLYGQETFPATTYLPIMAKNHKGKILHPKSVIMKIKEEVGKDVYVKVRKKFGQIGYELTEEEEEWYNNAFKEQRFMMKVKTILHPSDAFKKHSEFMILFDYKMDENLSPFFQAPKDNQTTVIVKELFEKKGEYVGILKIPLGKIKQNKLLFKSSTGEYEKEKGTSDFKKNDIRLDIEPKILTEEEKEDFLKLKEQKIRDKETKIQNDIKEAEKAKEEEEERFKKLTEEMKIIPCKLEDIYIYVKTEIIMDEQLLLEIFALLEKDEFSLFRLIFHIYEDYCKLYFPNTLSIDGNSEFNFLNTYFSGLPDIIIDFQNEYITRFEKQLEQIEFKEFIYILIYVLNCTEKHQSIKIDEQIASISSTYEDLCKQKAFYHLFSNPFLLDECGPKRIGKLNEIFMKSALKKGKTEFMIMDGAAITNFAQDIANKNKYNFHVMTSEEGNPIKQEYDFIDFLKILIAMSINCQDSIKESDEGKEVDAQGIQEEDLLIAKYFCIFVDKIIQAKGDLI